MIKPMDAVFIWERWGAEELCLHRCVSLGLYSNNCRVTDSDTLAGYRSAAKSLLIWL